MLNVQSNFGQRVKELRLASGMTQEQLGEAVGVSKQAIQNMEVGRRETTLSRVVSLANFFNVDANYLLGRIQTPDSMVIEEIAYNDGTLFVHFRDNDWYSYLDVPKEVYESFVDAPSKGQFFLKNIMPEYSCSICDEPVCR